MEQEDLQQFCRGTRKWYQFNPYLCKEAIVSEGVQHIADHGGRNGCYWLIETIIAQEAHNQNIIDAYDGVNVYFWVLEMEDHEDEDISFRKAKLKCIQDLGMEPLFSKEIELADCDLDKITFCVSRQMPDEYIRIFLIEEY